MSEHDEDNKFVTRLFLGWLFLSCLGYSLTYIFSIVLGIFFYILNIREVAFPFWLIGIVAGFATASLQWFSLKQKVRRPLLWVIASTLGWGFTMYLITLPSLFLEWFHGLLLGSVVGFFQYLVLRKYFTQALWWIPTSILAGFVGLMVFNNFGVTLSDKFLLGSVVAEIIRAIFLVWVLFGPVAPPINPLALNEDHENKFN